MPNLDSAAWLLVSFLLFVFAVFKKAKSFISSAISKYQNAVLTGLDEAASNKEKSQKDLEDLKKQTLEIEAICEKILNSSINYAAQAEIKAKNEMESYLAFKEKYMEEKIKIFIRQKVQTMKAIVLNMALDIVYKNLAKEKSNNANIIKEIQNVFSQNTILKR